MLRIRELRRQKQYNQERLAMELNVSQATISAYETGDRTPDVETLKRIAIIFNVSVDYLIGNSDLLKTSFSDLTPGELEFLRLYQRLSLLQKEKAIAYMRGMLSL